VVEVDTKYVSRHLDEIERFILRPADYSLTVEQTELRDVVRAFLAKQCPSELVRAAEPLGWDAGLWDALVQLGLIAIAVPEARGGDGGGLVELALMAEETGRAAAPVPIIDVVVVARLLARLDGAAAAALLDRCLEGRVMSLTVGDGVDGRFLVPNGAIASTVIGVEGGAVVAVTRSAPPPHVPNLAAAPLAWWELENTQVLAEGDVALSAFALALDEWRLLTAAALIGAGESAKRLAAEYARDRNAFGVSIGTFQAVAHPLADLEIHLDTGRRLVHKAAWYADHEPNSLGPLVTMAFVHAAEAAEEAGLTAIRTQGGFGFTLESDVQLHYRHAKGWALVGGDRGTQLQRIADELLGVRA
jgi:alkylation response protein AidB-like acyl-CoA dehydrogenase